MNKTVMGLLAVLVVVVLGFTFMGGGDEATQATAPAIESGNDTAAAVDSATGAATDATAAVTDAANTAADTAGEAASDVANAAADAADTATGAATDMAGDTQMALGDLLTVDKFDFDKVVAAIETSDLAATEKASLTTALDDARNDPAKLQDVLQEVRQALDI